MRTVSQKAAMTDLRMKLASHLRKWSPFKFGLIADAIERGESRPVPSEIALSFASEVQKCRTSIKY